MKHSFETTTSGKWILAGEHTVLRGGAALVFPLPTAQLKFGFVPDETDLRLRLSGSTGPDFEVLFWSVLEKACSLTGVRREAVKGQVHLSSEIPVGAGLGASAAFCVAVARWFAGENAIPKDNIENFARELENLFHGESSGVDIAVAHTGKPLKFRRNGERSELVLNWQPHFFLSYSGQRGVTKECVFKVKELWNENSSIGEDIDRMMSESVLQAEKALTASQNVGLPALAKAIKLSSDCFAGWGLFDGKPESAAQELYRKGALAVKPTGSGGGGYLLSLWSGPIPADLKGFVVS